MYLHYTHKYNYSKNKTHFFLTSDTLLLLEIKYRNLLMQILG